MLIPNCASPLDRCFNVFLSIIFMVCILHLGLTESVVIRVFLGTKGVPNVTCTPNFKEKITNE